MHDRSDNQQALAGRQPWNKGRLIGQKPALKLKDVWAIRLRLQLADRVRDLELFNLALDSKLRGCDLVRLRVADISHGESVMPRATVIQHKTGRPVRFELTEPTREAIRDWPLKAQLRSDDALFPSRSHRSSHLSTRQYARFVKSWVMLVGWAPGTAGPTPYDERRRRASTAGSRSCETCSSCSDTPSWKAHFRYLGIEVDDALEIAEHTEM